MVKHLNFAVDDDTHAQAERVKDDLGLSWPEFFAHAAEVLDETDDSPSDPPTAQNDESGRKSEPSPEPIDTPQNSDGARDAARGDRGSPPDDDTGGSAPKGEFDADENTHGPRDWVADHLADVEFPEGRDRDDCLTAATAATIFLHEHGQASMREIVTEVMPDHPVGYDVPELEPGDRYRGAWWRRVVKPALSEIPTVDAPTGGGKWRWVGPDSNADVYDPTQEFE